MRVFPNSVYLRVGSCAVGVLVAALAVFADVGGGPKKFAKVTVKVVDSRGRAVEGVPVTFYAYSQGGFQFCECFSNGLPPGYCRDIAAPPRLTDAKGKVVVDGFYLNSTNAVCLYSQCTSTSTDNLCQADSDCIFSGNCQQFTAPSKGGGNLNILFTLP